MYSAVVSDGRRRLFIGARRRLEHVHVAGQNPDGTLHALDICAASDVIH
jgi:hypothetical protein